MRNNRKSNSTKRASSMPLACASVIGQVRECLLAIVCDGLGQRRQAALGLAPRVLLYSDNGGPAYLRVFRTADRGGWRLPTLSLKTSRSLRAL